MTVVRTTYTEVEVEPEEQNPLPRPMITMVRNVWGTRAIVGAEIGVDRGLNARSMLETLPGLVTLYLIDPYTTYKGYPSGIAERLADSFRCAIRLMLPYTHRVRWVIAPSSVAVSLIPEKLDYVYLDGNHDSPYIDEDILHWSLLVKPYGYLGGHDIELPSVKTAVRAFSEGLGLHVEIVDTESHRDWWVQIPPGLIPG